MRNDHHTHQLWSFTVSGCMLTCWFSSSLHNNSPAEVGLLFHYSTSTRAAGPLTQITTRLLSWWTGARSSSSSSMCTLAWKTYQFTQLAPRPEKAILLGVPEARSTHTVRISQLFDYSGKSLWKIDSVNARPVAGPVSITITSVSR